MQLEGRQIARYHFEHLIGSGMCEVYLAQDQRIPGHVQNVAIKVLQSDDSPATDPDAAKKSERFQREARIIAQLHHPRIIRLLDYGEERIDEITITYIVMPYYKNRSLYHWWGLRGRNPLSPQVAAHFISQAAETLQYAHDQKVVHRDVKPNNFLIDTEKNVDLPDLVLTDFGIAKFSDAIATQTTRGASTPIYTAPEQFSGYAQATTDQYALAIMAYELLTGRAPFQGPPNRVMYQHIHDKPKPPCIENPGLPKAFDKVLLRALEKQPENRYFSISEFARAFQQAVQGGSGIPPPSRGSDIHQILRITSEQAQRGTNSTITLPGGRSVNVRVPANVHYGQVISLAGQGEPSPNGGLPGNLLVTIEVIPSPPLKGSDIRASLPISPAEAQTGTSRLLPLPGGRQVPVQVPANAFNGQVITLTGQGEPSRSGGPPGNLFVTLNIIPEIPKPRPRKPVKLVIGFSVVLAVLVLCIVGFAVIRPEPTPPVDTNATATAQANINATATVQANINATATANAQALQNPYGGGGTLKISDPLSDNSKGYNWDVGSDNSGTSCKFTAGGYQVTQRACIARNTTANFSDLAYQVQMTITQGDKGGIIFRFDPANQTYYYFNISTSGSYELYRFDGSNGSTRLTGDRSSAIKPGLNQTNTIVVQAIGANMYIYINPPAVNPQPIIRVSDSNYSSGQIGLVAFDPSNSSLVNIAVFSNIMVWA